MSFEIEAVYENGVLKPDRPLPLNEHQRVTVVVQNQESLARKAYGIIGWQGEADAVRKIATDAEFGSLESP